MSAKLYFEGPDDRREISLDDAEEIVIGRSGDCSVQLMHPSISRRHCTIERTGDCCVVTDLGSVNGTYVNQQRIEAPIRFGWRDQASIGRYLLRFQPEGADMDEASLKESNPGQREITIIQPPSTIEESSFLAPVASHSGEGTAQRTHNGLMVLYKISKILHESSSLDVVHDAILAALETAIPADRLLILDADRDGDNIRILRDRSGSSGTSAPSISRSIIRETFASGGVILSRDLQHDKRFDESQSIVLGGVRSVISAPLVFEDRSFGILYLDSCSDENVFIEADAEMVGAISNQVASTLYRHDLIEQRKRVQLTAMQKLAVLAEQRDPETGEHLSRVSHYAVRLAQQISEDPKFTECGSDRFLDALAFSTPLHDIGKVGIPDRILLKPGRLADEEFEVMKTHTTIGAEVLQGPEFLGMAGVIALSHHERWDGGGYPEGRKGDESPLAARIMAVADVYDALRSRRVYKEPFSHEKTCEIVLEGSGNHFDPDLIAAFRSVESEFAGIFTRYSDA